MNRGPLAAVDHRAGLRFCHLSSGHANPQNKVPNAAMERPRIMQGVCSTPCKLRLHWPWLRSLKLSGNYGAIIGGNQGTNPC